MGNWRQFASPFRWGCLTENSDELNRRIIAINVFASIGVLLVVIFSINAYRTHSIWMGNSIALVGFTFITARYFLKTNKEPSEQLIPISLLIVSLLALMTLVIVTGGINNNGPLWIFVLPPVAFFFAGLRYGLFIIFAFTVFISFLFFYPDNQMLQTSYGTNFKIRLITVFTTTTLFYAAYEYIRGKNMETINCLKERFEHLALHDALTGIPNRRAMNLYLQREVIRAKRTNSPLSFILCDIDKFKLINDKSGHDVGDEVLKSVSKLLRENIRKQDLVARWGGEEFLFALPETDIDSAVKVAETIRTRLSKAKFDLDINEQTQITGSFGVSVINDEFDLDTAISNADKALYEAKYSGRNKVKDQRDIKN